MPLPDERPRQSVANLIGRFENQTKRQSLSGVPPRSSSVVSHTTGDSAKEEVKEKREWPPKSLPSDATLPPPIIPSSSWSRRQSQSSPASQALSPPMVTLDMPSEVAVSIASDLEVATPNTAKPSAALQKQANSGNSERLAQKPATTNARTSGASTRASAPNPVTSPPSRTPIKPSVKSTPRPPPSATASQPLKPQHTGQSTTSTTSTRKPVTKVAPTTPARPKTPSRTVANASRAKTPTASRPKTPSTGLFAPTAASLARARSAQPQPPTPTKKTTISSGSSDRLSKPTAASLSKARSPPAASPRAKPTAHGTPTRGVPKPKSTSLSTRPKDESLAIVGGTGAAVAAAVAAVGMIATLDAEDIPDETSEEDQNHGLEPPSKPLPSQEDEAVEGNVGVADEAEVHKEMAEEIETHEEVGDEGSMSHEVHEEPEPLEEENIIPQGTTVDSEPSESAEAASPEAESVEVAPASEQAKTLPAETEAEAEVDLRSTPEVEEDAPVSTSEPEPEAAAEPKALAEVAEKDQVAATTHTSPPVFSGNNIEDIVNLLESAPIKLRPEIPDEVHEIPDEE